MFPPPASKDTASIPLHLTKQAVRKPPCRFVLWTCGSEVLLLATTEECAIFRGGWRQFAERACVVRTEWLQPRIDVNEAMQEVCWQKLTMLFLDVWHNRGTPTPTVSEHSESANPESMRRKRSLVTSVNP